MRQLSRPVSASLILLLLLETGCSRRQPASDAGLRVHQIVVMPSDERLQVLEDERITPALRTVMWGGDKDTVALLQTPGLDLDAGIRRALGEGPVRRALLRLVDRSGAVLAERRFDCELGEIAEPPLAQGDGGRVWAVGDDCSTGDGAFAGLITRFLTPPSDRISFEKYRDPATDETNELTLVTAAKIRWHLVSSTDAILVHEVASHPDFDSAQFKQVPPDQPVPNAVPWVTEYVTYRWDGAASWLRHERVSHDAADLAARDFPAAERFPAD